MAAFTDGTANGELQNTLLNVRLVHCLHGVACQVQQDLLHHGPVAHHGWRLRLDVGQHPHAQLVRLQVDQGQDGVEQTLRCHRFAHLLAPAYKVVHALDDLAGPFGLLGDALHRHLQIRAVHQGRVSAILQQIDGAVGVA